MALKDDGESEPSFWWRSIEDECPITLEPIQSFPYPPFVLGNSCFDGAALASYVVSRATFENPLTREPMTWDECRNLDEYLDRYHHGQSIRVSEAFGLREKVQVRRHSSATTAQQRRRAEALRSEATAAICGLFVYRSNTNRSNTNRRNGSANNQQSVTGHTLPRFGFDLQNEPATDSMPPEMEGLQIIDDDEAIAVASDRQAWQELQAAFPELPRASNNDGAGDEDAGNDSVRDQPETLDFLEKVRETAERFKVIEKEQDKAREQVRKMLVQETIRHREASNQRKQQSHTRLRQQRHHREMEEAEIREAKAEIERWREEQWQALLAMREQQQQQQQKAEQARRKAAEEQRSQKEPKEPTLPAMEDEGSGDQDEFSQQQKKAKAAAKRKRARERKKAKKLEGQKIVEQKEKQAALKSKRDASKVRCSHCGIGLLDPGFEKHGNRFCSPNCARAGAT